jgi:hypothetical protein
MLVDGDSSRTTPSHAAKKSTRYRYYVSRPLITKDQTQKYEGSASPLSSSWAEFADDSTLETWIRTIGPAEGTRRPRGFGSRSRRVFR